MYPDIPWEYDPLRENPHDRLELFEQFEYELKQFGKTYHIIQGGLHQRIHDALYWIEKFENTPTN
jgi:nicotinamide riboside kinase